MSRALHAAPAEPASGALHAAEAEPPSGALHAAAPNGSAYPDSAAQHAVAADSASGALHAVAGADDRSEDDQVDSDALAAMPPVTEKDESDRYGVLTGQPEIKQEAATRGKHGRSPYDAPKPQISLPRGKKLAALIAGCVALVAVIVVVAVAIFSAYSSDVALKDRATAAKQNSASTSMSLELPTKTDEGNYAANIAGGGLVANDANARYFALSSGLYKQQGDADSDLEQICADKASYLNLRAGKLYYVSAASGKTSSSGSSSGSSSSSSSAATIKSCKPGEASAVVYQAPEGSVISYLSLWDETMYFVVAQNGTSTLYQLPASGGEPKQVLAKQCRKLCAFVEKGKLYAITVNDGNWTAQRASLGSGAVTFQSWGGGSGNLQGVCVSDGSLLYSQKGGHVSRMTATGEMKEISETSDAPLILAGADTLFAFESSGQLHIANTSLGLLNDSVDAVDGWLGQQVVASASAGIADGTMYISSSKGACVACDLVNGTVSEVKVGA